MWVTKKKSQVTGSHVFKHFLFAGGFCGWPTAVADESLEEGSEATYIYFFPIKKYYLGNRFQKGEKCPINGEPIETFQSNWQG